MTDKTPAPKHSRTIKVDYLARVEGEGALHIRIKDDVVQDVKLKIFEPPRFFEAFLRGRQFTEAVDITARICGICPVAYQAGAMHAMEDACGVTAPTAVRDLRHLLYCGEWIESHVLHMAMLHAPDFLGFQDAVQMAKQHPDVVKLALKLKKLGNDIMVLVGGREIHPINPRVGGFYKAPDPQAMAALAAELDWGCEAAEALTRFAAGLDFPAFEQDYEFVALQHPTEYAILDGRLVSNKGLDCDIHDFLEHVEEHQVKHSTSLHARMKARDCYMVGPLARYTLNSRKLHPAARALAEAIGQPPEERNPFRSIVIRGLEVVHACNVARDIARGYTPPRPAAIEVTPRAGEGVGCTEAPRGICWHRYRIDAEGLIEDARIIPPTSQNQSRIEQDLYHFVAPLADLPEDELVWRCEQAVRNYDPCISCSCHFLKLHLDRS